MTTRSPALAALMLGGCATMALTGLSRFETDQPEFALTRGPDGFYVGRMEGSFGQNSPSSIWRYPENGAPPEIAGFSRSAASQSGFTWNKQSQRACFEENLDIRCMEWSTAGQWSDPVTLPAPVNTGGYEASPHLAADDSLYFASSREGGSGEGDIYRATLLNGDWSVILLGPAINSETGEWNVTLSPDGRIMVFEASGRATNRTVSGDLYASCLMRGEWQPAWPLDALNTDNSDLEFRFSGMREGYFTTATIGGDGVLRYAGPENFERCGSR